MLRKRRAIMAGRRAPVAALTAWFHHRAQPLGSTSRDALK